MEETAWLLIEASKKPYDQSGIVGSIVKKGWFSLNVFEGKGRQHGWNFSETGHPARIGAVEKATPKCLPSNTPQKHFSGNKPAQSEIPRNTPLDRLQPT